MYHSLIRVSCSLSLFGQRNGATKLMNLCMSMQKMGQKEKGKRKWVPKFDFDNIWMGEKG